MNKTNRETMTEEVLSAVSASPIESLKKLLTAWEEEKEIGKFSLRDITGLSGEKLQNLTLLFENYRNSKDTVMMMIDASLQTKKLLSTEQNKSEIVWTGPVQVGAHVKNTKSVIEEMLSNAKQSVTIVGYRITKNAESVIEEIGKCLNRGINMRIIIDNDEKKINKEEIITLFSKYGPKQPIVFTRKKQEGTYYKVHAKIIIVDKNDLLVTSANLTYHGMSNNFEIGIRSRGPIVEKALNLVDEMIDNKYFEEM